MLTFSGADAAPAMAGARACHLALAGLSRNARGGGNRVAAARRAGCIGGSATRGDDLTTTHPAWPGGDSELERSPSGPDSSSPRPAGQVPLPGQASPEILSGTGQAREIPGDDEQALLSRLPQDRGPVASQAVRRQLGWDQERYASTCFRLEDQGSVLSEQGRSRTIRRDLTAVRAEFRPACGHPGAHVAVRQVPATVPHTVGDLSGVALSCPGGGGPPPRAALAGSATAGGSG
jgi:hypothetical protein